MEAAECLQLEAMKIADDQNHLVLRSVLKRLDDKTVLFWIADGCSHCRLKDDYVEAKLRLHRLKKRLQWDYPWEGETNLNHRIEQSRMNVFLLKRAKDAHPCICIQGGRHARR